MLLIAFCLQDSLAESPLQYTFERIGIIAEKGWKELTDEEERCRTQ